ncbi:hypothetical protein ACOSP7_015092 [Xanthoceras sorbifolium]
MIDRMPRGIFQKGRRAHTLDSDPSKNTVAVLTQNRLNRRSLYCSSGILVFLFQSLSPPGYNVPDFQGLVLI